MTGWITESPTEGGGVEQEVFVTLDDGRVKLKEVL